MAPLPSSELRRVRVTLDARAFAGQANANRTPGIHLTDVLDDIETTLGRGYGDNGLSEEQLSQFALQGYLWEDCMSETLKNKVRRSDGKAIGVDGYLRLPELAVRLDGSAAMPIDPELPAEINAELARGCLIMSPDGGISTDGTTAGMYALLECKWTTKSANMQPERDKRIWFHQVKGYLVGVSIWLQRFVGQVQWHVQFSRGEYKGGDPPIYEVMEREYEPQECWSTWSMVVEQVKWRTTGELDGRGGGTDPRGWRAYL